MSFRFDHQKWAKTVTFRRLEWPKFEYHLSVVAEIFQSILKKKFFQFVPKNPIKMLRKLSLHFDPRKWPKIAVLAAYNGQTLNTACLLGLKFFGASSKN